MLPMILDTLVANTTPQVTPQVKELLKAIAGSMSRDELQTALDLKDRKSFCERYLKPALEAELIEMTLPGKRNRPLQRYRLIKQGV